jgi:hypothetical protein
MCLERVCFSFNTNESELCPQQDLLEALKDVQFLFISSPFFLELIKPELQISLV